MPFETFRGEDDTRESLPSITEDSRRRASSQSDTLRSTRSDQSPRLLQRSHASVSGPPATPPLSRAAPHRHSISHAPTGGRPPAASIIAVPESTAGGGGASRDSLSLDSGNPSPDTTFTTSERRVSRGSPLGGGGGGGGSESDSRSLDFDSLSVDESLEFSDARGGVSGPPTAAESVTTVIHVPAAPPALDQSVQSAEIRTTALGSPSSIVEVRGRASPGSTPVAAVLRDRASPGSTPGAAEVSGPHLRGAPAADGPADRPLSAVETSL
jgi:hypothetical protein